MLLASLAAAGQKGTLHVPGPWVSHCRPELPSCSYPLPSYFCAVLRLVVRLLGLAWHSLVLSVQCFECLCLCLCVRRTCANRPASLLPLRAVSTFDLPHACFAAWPIYAPLSVPCPPGPVLCYLDPRAGACVLQVVNISAELKLQCVSLEEAPAQASRSAIQQVRVSILTYGPASV